jgi:hypothetical protein
MAFSSSSSSNRPRTKIKKKSDVMRAVREVEAINTEILLLELDFVRSIVEVLGPDCADAIRTTIVGNGISGEAGTLLRTLSERPLASVLSSFHGGTGDVGGHRVLGEINYPLPRPDHLIRVKIRIKRPESKPGCQTK